MSRLRTLLFWMHLATGVLVAAVVLVMSVTGVLLTYQRQVTAWADTRGLDGSAPVPGRPRLGAEALLEAVHAREGRLPTAVTWRADPDAPVQVAFGRERTLYLNAYTGATLGEGAAGTRAFFRKVTDWHRWLAAGDESRDRGKAITGAANLGFLFLVLSGLVLWFPRNLAARAFRNVMVFRRGLPPKARDFNWHNVIGFWSLVPLFVVVLSAVVISYPWASDLVYRAAGEDPPA
ncbi:MAG TPA: PepSY-associated TM helix domain-containing protein, partial [Longimicrobiaceae bacterium]|nr:PepSY-associated TM helix domain-containing protein [Longimicrobiaceae bacterium]